MLDARTAVLYNTPGMKQHITAQAWKRLKNWKERILLYQDICELSSFPEVAESLGVTNGNVVSWFVGKSSPTPYVATQIRRACVEENDEDKNALWNTVMSQSYDCSLNFYNHCLVSQDATKLSTALCLIGNKVLKLLYSGDGFLKVSTFLCYRDSLFGSSPAWERIKITPVQELLRHIALTICISAAAGKFILAATLESMDNIVFEYVVTMSDANLVKFVKKISSELTRLIKAESIQYNGRKQRKAKRILRRNNISGSGDTESIA